MRKQHGFPPLSLLCHMCPKSSSRHFLLLYSISVLFCSLLFLLRWWSMEARRRCLIWSEEWKAFYQDVLWAKPCGWTLRYKRKTRQTRWSAKVSQNGGRYRKKPLTGQKKGTKPFSCPSILRKRSGTCISPRVQRSTFFRR